MIKNVIIGAILLTIAAAPFVAPHLSKGQTPTPTPFSLSDEEVNKLSWDDLVATIVHQQRIFKQEHETVAQLQQHLDAATNSAVAAAQDATGGLVHVDTLEGGIKVLAAHDASETARANKLDKAVWWYRVHFWLTWIMFGLGLAACVLLVILKVTGKLAIFGTAVASKIP
jgi:hypothetical protein